MCKGRILLAGAPVDPATILTLSKADYQVGIAWDCQGQAREIYYTNYNAVIINEVDEFNEQPAPPSPQICSQIRQLSPAPIIVISQDRNPHTLADTIAAGADYCLRGPLRPLELVARIDALLRHQREPAIPAPALQPQMV